MQLSGKWQRSLWKGKKKEKRRKRSAEKEREKKSSRPYLASGVSRNAAGMERAG